MAVNKALMRKTLAFIEKHPEKHDQGNWCGTTQCFAGWACYLDGWRPLDVHEMNAIDGDPEASYGFSDETSECVKQGGTIGHVAEIAASVLGVSDQERYELFDGSQTVADLRRIVKGLCK